MSRPTISREHPIKLAGFHPGLYPFIHNVFEYCGVYPIPYGPHLLFTSQDTVKNRATGAWTLKHLQKRIIHALLLAPRNDKRIEPILLSLGSLRGTRLMMEILICGRRAGNVVLGEQMAEDALSLIARRTI